MRSIRGHLLHKFTPILESCEFWGHMPPSASLLLGSYAPSPGPLLGNKRRRFLSLTPLSAKRQKFSQLSLLSGIFFTVQVQYIKAKIPAYTNMKITRILYFNICKYHFPSTFPKNLWILRFVTNVYFPPQIFSYSNNIWQICGCCQKQSGICSFYFSVLRARGGFKKF